jgi:hypothetical protein
MQASFLLLLPLFFVSNIPNEDLREYIPKKKNHQNEPVKTQAFTKFIFVLSPFPYIH